MENSKNLNSNYKEKNLEFAKNKLKKLETDKAKIDKDLLKYFDTQRDDNSAIDFIDPKDKEDHEDLISRRILLAEKIEKWGKEIKTLTN